MPIPAVMLLGWSPPIFGLLTYRAYRLLQALHASANTAVRRLGEGGGGAASTPSCAATCPTSSPWPSPRPASSTSGPSPAR